MAGRIIDLPLAVEVIPRLVEPGNFHRTSGGTRVFTYTGVPYWEVNVSSGSVNYDSTKEEVEEEPLVPPEEGEEVVVVRQVPPPTLSVGDKIRFPHKNRRIGSDTDHGGTVTGMGGRWTYSGEIPASIKLDDFVRAGSGPVVRVISVSGGNLQVSPAIDADGSLVELNALVGTITGFASGRIRGNIRGPYNFVVELD